MKVKMLKAVHGKVNGVHMGPYYLGHEYDMDDDRARLFIGSAMAEEVLPPVELIGQESTETIEVQTVGDESPEYIPSRRGRKKPDAE